MDLLSLVVRKTIIKSLCIKVMARFDEWDIYNIRLPVTIWREIMPRQFFAEIIYKMFTDVILYFWYNASSFIIYMTIYIQGYKYNDSMFKL